MADKQYDRSAQDLGNIVNLGHVNVCISDQHLATNYYISGLGLTRDPFLNTGARAMWVNVGTAQFHLPMGQPDILRGVTGLVVPDRAALLDRLTQLRKPLEGTRFDFRESNDCVETVCPWGNRINVHAPDAEPLRPHRAGNALYRVRRAAGHRGAHRPFLSRGHRRARRAWSRTAAAAKPASRWARSNTGISARPTRRRSPTTATTRRSTSPISPAPIGG